LSLANWIETTVPFVRPTLDGFIHVVGSVSVGDRFGSAKGVIDPRLQNPAERHFGTQIPTPFCRE
jgi:hypothetical protein